MVLTSQIEMNEHSFDNLFGSQLPDLADKNWGKLQGKLEQFNLQRKLAKIVLILYGLGIFSGLMMGLAGVMYYQMAQNAEKTKKIEMALVSSYQKKYYAKDTIHQKIIVHDTVYRTTVIVAKERKNNYSDPYLNQQNLHNQNVYYQKSDEASKQETIFVEREKYLDLKRINAKESRFNQMRLAGLNLIKIDSINPDTVMNVPKFSLKPNSVSVGLMGGYQIPSGTTFQMGDGFDYGVRTVLGYNNRKGQERWGIVFEVQKIKYLFNNEEVQRGVFNLPPNISPLSDSQIKGGNMKEISTYQLGLGLRYNLLFNSNLQPYFGLNWSVQIPNSYQVSYLIEDKVDQKEKRIVSSYDNLKPIFNILGANVGINYNLSNRFSGGLELYYQKQNLSTIETPKVIGTRFTLNYRLGK
jgi:hypothetical protein